MGEWMVDPCFPDLITSLEVSGQLHALAALPRRKSLNYLLDRKPVGPKAGQDDVERRKFVSLPGLEI
jgi:hypothetical protein